MNPEVIIGSDLQILGELQPDGWPDIIPSFEFYISSPFCNPVKIITEDRVAGIGAGNTFGKTGWLSHIITHPEFRNRGIAGSIVDHLLNKLKNSGCGTISLIATEYGYPVYKKAGFKIQSEYSFFERKKPLNNIFQSDKIVRFADIYRDDVIALDKKISGEDRSCLLIDKLKNSYVYLEDNRISGYYLPGLGEGLIIADNSEAGIELLRLRCSLSAYTVLPYENNDGISFLKNQGYIETRRVKRMIFGEEFEWHPEKLFSRIAGNFG